MLHTCLLPSALADLFVQVSSTGQITQADRYGLQAACLCETLSEDERSAIDRLLRATLKKRICLSQELSCLESECER